MTNNSSPTKSVVIIGGGIGGLFTGALLAKNGIRVTVLEKNSIAGGGLQCFRRGEALFETGMHVLGGFQQGGSIQRILSYLGIYDTLHLRAVDNDCIDSIHFCSDSRTYSMPHGREALESYLITQFPEEEHGIRHYLSAIYAMSEEVDLFYLRPAHHDIFSHSDEFYMPADLFIAKYVNSPRLRALLSYMNPMYGGVAGHTPAYIHALINVLYINGSHFFEGGSQQLADALCNIISVNGGQVLTGDAVEKIVCADRFVRQVVTHKGLTFSADRYVCAIHPALLIDIIEGEGFSPAYCKRLKSIPNTYSAFSVYIKLKPQVIPYANHPCYVVDDYASVWNLDTLDAQWPKGLMYFTPPDINQGTWAKRIIANCIIECSSVSPWAGSCVGHRPTEYIAWKKEMQERILDRLSSVIPAIRTAIDEIFTSSPLTIRDYYGTPGGALYGYRIDCENPVLAQVPIATKIQNLFLTGQNINLHGICGVPLTAITTAEAILGKDSILPQL